MFSRKQAPGDLARADGALLQCREPCCDHVAPGNTCSSVHVNLVQNTLIVFKNMHGGLLGIGTHCWPLRG